VRPQDDVRYVIAFVLGGVGKHRIGKLIKIAEIHHTIRFSGGNKPSPLPA